MTEFAFLVIFEMCELHLRSSENYCYLTEVGCLQYGLKYMQRLSISTGESTAHAYSEKDGNNYAW